MADALGFVGVGHIGSRMAGRLLAHGHALFVRDIDPAAARAFEGRPGVTVCRSPRDVAERVPVVLLSLSSPAALEEVVLGADGIASAGHACTVIDLSTSGVKASRTVAAAAAASGLTFVDAPVSGGVVAAEEGRLSIMAATDDATFARCQPLLSVLGAHVFHVGRDAGLGQVVKLANNILAFGSFVATAEALLVTTKAGIDPHVALDVINVSSGRSRTTEEMFPRTILTRAFFGGGHVDTTLKDAKLFEALAEELHIPMLVCPAVVNAWRVAAGNGIGGEDFTEIVRMLERWSGVEIRAATGPRGR